MDWLNEPPDWREEDGVLTVTTGAKTDFWRETHYGFVRDDGHFRHRSVSGDFSATVEFSGEYQELYDQAGLMLRLDEKSWIKAGIEFVGGRQMLSVVATRDFSDWSTMPLPATTDWVKLRLTRQGTAVRVDWGIPGAAAWGLLRLAYLPSADALLAGPMCCSPQRGDFVARFRAFDVGPPAGEALHD